MNNIVITSVMYYALFHEHLITDEMDIVDFLPKNTFGVFSTVRRARKIKSYPIDIHGCIGYWDAHFNTLNKTLLYNNVLRVAYDSVWTDTRNRYFTPIETDSETVIEVDFMLNPIYNINKKNGVIIELNTLFTNKSFGIIIQTVDKTQKATYLPNVFPIISWKNMIISLKQKAGITTNDYEIFAYKISQIKSKIINILTGDFFRYIRVLKFSRLLIDNMKLNLKFPFIYSRKNDILYWKSTEDVINSYTLGRVFEYINLYPDIATKTEFKNIKQKIFNVLQDMDHYSSHSLSFFGYIYQLFNINKEPFCKKLLKDLPFAENDFERPGIIIGLNKAHCYCNEKEYLPTYNSTDSIFKMNQTIQVIISFNKKPSNRLIFILENKIDDIIINIKKIETNYIAVAFEALCFIYVILRKRTLLNKMFGLFFELEKRNNGYDDTLVVDITGHIINGLVELRI